MNKLFFEFSACVFISIFLASCSSKGAIASVNGTDIYKKDLSRIDRMQRIMYGENDVLDGNLLFDRIKDLIFISLAEKLETGYSKTSADEYMSEMMMSGYAPAYVMDVFKKSGKPDFKEYFLTPYIAVNMFSDFTTSDTILFQKKQYNEAMSILMKWKPAKDDDYKNFISPSADYFEQSVTEGDFADLSPSHMKDEKMLIDDPEYFYTVTYKDGRIRGFRILKSPIDSVLDFLKDSVDVKIYSPSYERSLMKITEGTVWNSIIFK